MCQKGDPKVGWPADRTKGRSRTTLTRTAVSGGGRLGHDEVTAWSAKAAWASPTLNNLTYTTLLRYWNPYIDAIGELEKAGDTRALALEPIARPWQIVSHKL